MIFSCWEETIPAIPPRSQLYSITPLNLGTSSVESLTSYVCRLASEHHTQLGTLVQYIIAPRIDKPYITTGQGRSISSFLRYAVPVNGNGLMASDWVSALQSLTLQEDLSLLTLLIGANALSHRDLLQPVRQWCSMCYNEWQQLGALIYEPLLWSINGITACPEHGQRLERCCPYCSSSLPLLTWCSRPGYCSSCGRWLGKANRKSQVGEKEMYIAETVGEFLAYMPQLSLTIPRERVIHSLQELIAATTDGNMAAFSRKLGPPKTSLWELVHGHFPPSLPFLLHLCYQFRLSLVQLLIDVEPIASDKSPLPEKQIQRHDARGLFDHGKVQQTLEEILSDQQRVPVSMQTVAQRLGYHARTISTHFPEHCRIITLRYKEYRRQQGEHRKSLLRTQIYEAALIVQKQGMKLTYQRVGAVLGKPGCFREYEMRRTFLDVCQQLDQAVSNHDRGHKKV